MTCTVDGTSRPGLLRLSGTVSAPDIASFVEAHDRAIDAFEGRGYHVFCDIRELVPLSPVCAALFERAKKYSATRPNFRGSAVLVSGALASMQHRRTSVAGGVMETELISDDERVCWRHLTVVWRSLPAPV